MYLDYDLTLRIQRYEYSNHVTTTPSVDPSETAARGRSVETDARAPRVRSTDRSDEDEDDDEDDEDVRARDAIEVRDAMMTR